MKKFLSFLALIKNTLNGNFAYQNYLAHAPNIPLNKKDFLLQRQKEKWKKVNRCC